MSMWSGLGSVLGGVAGSFIAPGIGTAIGASLGGALGGQADNMQAWNYSKKAQSRQNAYQTQMWMMNNDYNSPVSVMQRLEEAGLNPNLVYGNGGASYQATMPTAAKASFNYQNADGALRFQQQQNMETQHELLKNQNLLTAANATNVQYQNQIAVQNLTQQKLKTAFMEEFYRNNGYLPASTLTDIGTSISNKVGAWFAG